MLVGYQSKREEQKYQHAQRQGFMPRQGVIEKQDIKKKGADDEKLADGKIERLWCFEDDDNAKAQQGIDKPHQHAGAQGLKKIDHGDLYLDYFNASEFL